MINLFKGTNCGNLPHKLGEKLKILLSQLKIKITQFEFNKTVKII